MFKILVVEDDNYLRRDLKEILIKNGYDVVTAASVAEAVDYVDTDDNIDLYLLDLWLPDGEGFTVCSRIRQRNLKPVIFLTVCDHEEYVVKGLNMGGDDYVTKPFRTGELLSRIQANLRRTENQGEKFVLKCGELMLEQEQGCVKKGDISLHLSPVEFNLLLKLMENSGRILKREQLHSCLWDGYDDVREDNTLSVNISRLRSKIGNEYIETVRGFGYRFNGKVSRIISQ